LRRTEDKVLAGAIIHIERCVRGLSCGRRNRGRRVRRVWLNKVRRVVEFGDKGNCELGGVLRQVLQPDELVQVKEKKRKKGQNAALSLGASTVHQEAKARARISKKRNS
jgi:hypothetical protein